MKNKNIEQFKFEFWNKLEIRSKQRKTKEFKKEDEIEQFVFPFICNYETPQDQIS